MESTKTNLTEQLVYGLDIGTRSIVGTVGYQNNKKFHVIAMQTREHDDRVMLDGQIHKIEGVADEIKEVTEQLEAKLGRELDDVCIAAAGRVLRTVQIHVDKIFDEERDVTGEDVYSLELMGAEKAFSEFEKKNDTRIRFYCVGYTVERYYLNNYQMSSLVDHKAEEIGADIIATFLPEEVVDGLYKAVGMAGLRVANLTLEPIAAMEVAIPPSYRMLNIALLDVGAGTSDICITRDEAIIAYGMIPSAGDEITEVIAKGCLVDFAEAENIKRSASGKEPIVYHDIMGLEQTIKPDEVKKLIEPCISAMTKEIAKKIKKLNGNKSVSAVFVVGGGGKAPGFTEHLADELGIIHQRVAVRGEDVLKDIDFKVTGVTKDSLLVTPVGICLNYYNMKNNFIFLKFNGNEIKLYDNSNLRVSDAAMQAGYPNEDLFPKRGNELRFTFNGKKEVRRGTPGDAAVIKLNGKEVSISERVKGGDVIEVTPSTAGDPVTVQLGKLEGFNDSISVVVDGKQVRLPKFAVVNGELQNGFYEVQDGDNIEMRRYYKVEQVLKFLDIDPEIHTEVYVNNLEASPDTEVYDNFTIEWTKPDIPERKTHEPEPEDEVEDVAEEDIIDDLGEISEEESKESAEAEAERLEREASYKRMLEAVHKSQEKMAEITGRLKQDVKKNDAVEAEVVKAEDIPSEDASGEKPAEETDTRETAHTPGPLTFLDGPGKPKNKEIEVLVNNRPVKMTGKANYIYVDVFNYIDFDRSTPHGTSVATKINGRDAEFVEELNSGDRLEIYWRND
ncbi:MAG: cell division protein FtsA [Lachnospiraceae bacterium]|nr:cell division protein FtsA [Lachnospiraceae bacterium]